MCTKNFAAFAAVFAIAACMSPSATAVVQEAGHADRTVAKRVKGSYALDDGRTLQVSEKGRKLYADLGDGPVQIRHVGDVRFEAVGKDQDMRLDFEGGPFPHGVVLTIGSARQAAPCPVEPRFSPR